MASTHWAYTRLPITVEFLIKMGKAHFVRIVFCAATSLINVLYLPLLLKRLFIKRKQCPPIEDNILLLPATTLADKIRKKQVSCETVIRAYIKRIQDVNPLINAVVEDRYHAAIQDAQMKDKFLQETDLNETQLRERFPLFGLPLTVKGSMAVEGMAYNSGSRLRDIKAAEDATIVKLAREAGAIPLLVSNTPELCMSWETTNKVTGRTCNPYDTTRTVGGSSGGEAALLGAGASILGLGSDIAGSLRLPAHFCGVCSHKATPGTVSLQGHFPDCADQKAWEAVFMLGPMARYVEDLSLIFPCILKPEMKPVLQLEKPVDLSKIKVYYIENQKTILTKNINKNIKDAVHQVTAHLGKVCSGEPQMLDHPSLKHASELSYLHLLNINGIDNIFNENGEGVYTELVKYFFCSSNYTMVPIFYGLHKRLLHVIFDKYTNTDVKNKIQELKSDLTKLMDENSVIICPPFINEAHQHSDVYRKVLNFGYLTIFNVVGFPVTTCPVSLTGKGLPVGIQIAAAPNCDRLTLAVAREIERAFGGWQAPGTGSSKPVR